MSTDSTELTFVRCPACRSLVPAVSTRCRMCGATLDSNAKVEESQPDPQKSGRVRQRTQSSSSSDLAQAAGRIRQEMTAAPGEESAGSVSGAESSVTEAPPPVEPAPIAESPAPLAAAASTAGDDDPLGAYIQEVESEDSAQNGDHSASGALFDDEPASAPPASKPIPEPISEPKPRVIVETGPRKGGKPSNLSFGGSKGREEGGAERRESKPAEPRANEGRGAESGWQQVPSQQNPKHRDQNANQSRDMRQDQRRNDQQRRPDQSARPQREAPREQRRDAPRRGGDEVEFSQPQTGKLVGWLVSYRDARGTSIELREGRFFISGSALKPNDMVIEDPSLSTPHALVAVGVGEGFRVQDLMSERGVWVKRRSQDGFQKVTDAVRLEHGDWVRFGEVEYLVCLLAGGSSK